MGYVHYIVVRRDLTVGEACAQIAHAAGESFYAFGRRSSKTAERAGSLGEAAGSSPADGSTFYPEDTSVVVLGARNEQKLLRLATQLRQADIPFVLIREVDAPHQGEVMALGLHPAPRETVEAHVKEFQTFKGHEAAPA